MCSGLLCSAASGHRNPRCSGETGAVSSCQTTAAAVAAAAPSPLQSRRQLDL